LTSAVLSVRFPFPHLPALVHSCVVAHERRRPQEYMSSTLTKFPASFLFRYTGLTADGSRPVELFFMFSFFLFAWFRLRRMKPFSSALSLLWKDFLQCSTLVHPPRVLTISFLRVFKPSPLRRDALGKLLPRKFPHACSTSFSVLWRSYEDRPLQASLLLAAYPMLNILFHFVPPPLIIPAPSRCCFLWDPP